MGYAAALLAGLRRQSRGQPALAGLFLGLAVFARPFDAFLFAGPLLAWWAWSGRRRPGQLIAQTGWVAVGALPPLTAMAFYFRAATGSFLRPPFTFVGPTPYGPPEKCWWDESLETDHPGLLWHTYGKGRTAYFPWPVDALFYGHSLPECRARAWWYCPAR